MSSEGVSTNHAAVAPQWGKRRGTLGALGAGLVVGVVAATLFQTYGLPRLVAALSRPAATVAISPSYVLTGNDTIDWRVFFCPQTVVLTPTTWVCSFTMLDTESPYSNPVIVDQVRVIGASEVSATPAGPQLVSGYGLLDFAVAIGVPSNGDLTLSPQLLIDCHY